MKELTRRNRLAEIRWIPASEGGRSRPPSGDGVPPYAAVVRLLDRDGPEIDEPAWSLLVRKLEEGDDERQWLAEIAFRVGAAPHDALTTGRRFELYEGVRCVASGVVIGAAGDRSVCSAMIEPFDA